MPTVREGQSQTFDQTKILADPITMFRSSLIRLTRRACLSSQNLVSTTKIVAQAVASRGPFLFSTKVNIHRDSIGASRKEEFHGGSKHHLLHQFDAQKASLGAFKPNEIRRDAPKTLLDAFEDIAKKRPNARFMTQPVRGDKCLHWTYTEAMDEVKRMAAYLDTLNLEKRSHIALCSKSCSWWIMADLAIWFSGHVSVPVYPTLSHETVSYILEHSDSKLLFVGKLDEHSWSEMKSGIPKDMRTVSFPISPSQEHSEGKHEKWNDIIQKCDPIKMPVERSPDELATIIYTSGSTGRPKGVMHDFKTMLNATEGITKQLKPGSKDRYLSYLPLAHCMERFCGECTAMLSGMQLFFAESIPTFLADLKRARPTFFLSVPRLWSKFQLGVYKKMPQKVIDPLLKIPFLNNLIRKKVLAGLGLDCVRFAGSGSAPIPSELISWYRNLGIELLEGYGMTENFNYSHLSLPGKTRPGYVGNAYPDVDFRLAHNGEIQVKSPGQMIGYYKDETATKAAMTDDGYLCTGDCGEIDNQGRLKIIGRLKEIFKTSKGKYVAPAPIENKLANHHRVESGVVGGYACPQPYAILQLSEDAKNAVVSGEKDNIAKEMELHVEAVNATLDKHEKLDFVAIVKEEWLPENGMLTPTHKIVRRKIDQKYNPYAVAWHAIQKPVIWHGW